MNAIDDHSASELYSLLADQLDKLVARELSRELRYQIDQQGGCDAIWRPLDEAGFTHALVSEAAGGLGLSDEAAMLLVRRLAYHAAPVPMAESMTAHSLWVGAGGRLLDGMMTLGPVRAADRITGRWMGGDLRLSGRAERVPWGCSARHALLFVSDEDGKSYFCRLSPDLLLWQRGRNMAGEPRDTLLLDDVVVPADDVREPPDGGCCDGLLGYGARLRAQQMVGAMHACLDQAIAYANERAQFGRKIARFQAVQHMLAIAAGETAAATAAVGVAMSNADNMLAIAIGKSRASEAATKVAALTHQVFGAMGFTQEHLLHHSTRRLWSWRDECGNETYWNRRIGSTASAVGGEQLWSLVASL